MPRPKGSKNKPKVDANGKPLKPAAKPVKKAAPAKRVVAKKAAPKPALKKVKTTTLGTSDAPVAKAVVEETRANETLVQKIKAVVVDETRANETLVQKIEEEVKAVVEKAEEALGKKTQPSFPVNQPALAPEEPAAKSSVTKAVAGKNVGEAVIRAVDEDDDTDTGSHVVMVGGKAVLRKNKSNPDLD